MSVTDIKGVSYPKTKLGKTKMDKISDSAKVLFSQKGFFDTSINEICQQSNIAIGTFYIYFEDKIALYRYMADKIKTEVFAEINEAFTQKEYLDAKDTELQGLKAFVKYASKNTDYFNILWGSLSVDKNILTNFCKSFCSFYKLRLEQEQNQLVANVDIPSLTYVLMGISSFLALKLLVEKTTLSDQQIDEFAINSILPVLNTVFH